MKGVKKLNSMSTKKLASTAQNIEERLEKTRCLQSTSLPLVPAIEVGQIERYEEKSEERADNEIKLPGQTTPPSVAQVAAAASASWMCPLFRVDCAHHIEEFISDALSAHSTYHLDEAASAL